jgi:hypothetical protein
VNANEFLAQGVAPKRQSKLAPFRADLIQLQQANLTLDRMVEFLRINNVSAAKSTVAKFLARCSRGESRDRSKMADDKILSKQQNHRNDEAGTFPVSASPTALTAEPKNEGVDLLRAKNLSPKERQALIEKETAKFFPNRFAKATEN